MSVCITSNYIAFFYRSLLFFIWQIRKYYLSVFSLDALRYLVQFQISWWGMNLKNIIKNMLIVYMSTMKSFMHTNTISVAIHSHKHLCEIMTWSKNSAKTIKINVNLSLFYRQHFPLSNVNFKHDELHFLIFYIF